MGGDKLPHLLNVHIYVYIKKRKLGRETRAKDIALGEMGTSKFNVYGLRIRSQSFCR